MQEIHPGARVGDFPPRQREAAVRLLAVFITSEQGNILIIDDKKSDAGELRRVLRSEGYISDLLAKVMRSEMEDAHARVTAGTERELYSHPIRANHNDQAGHVGDFPHRQFEAIAR
jgi:hypothetical protein